MMIIKLFISIVVIWLIVISYLVREMFQKDEKWIAQQVHIQLVDRERKLVSHYSDELVQIQLDMGAIDTKKPQTIEDVIDIVWGMATSFNANDTNDTDQ